MRSLQDARVALSAKRQPLFALDLPVIPASLPVSRLFFIVGQALGVGEASTEVGLADGVHGGVLGSGFLLPMTNYRSSLKIVNWGNPYSQGFTCFLYRPSK